MTFCFSKSSGVDVEVGDGESNSKRFIPSTQGHYLVTENAV